MMRAGLNIYNCLKEFIYDEIIILAGPGNNGGDALAVGVHAKLNNDNVTVIKIKKYNDNTKSLIKLSKEINLRSYKFKTNILNPKKKQLIVDGILGIGISRKPQGNIAKIINSINKFKSNNSIIVSIDVPSGLNPNNGVANSITIKADHTIMCLTKKQGCFTGDGIEFSGKLHYTDLGIKNIKFIQKSNCCELFSCNKLLVKRNKTKHKGSFGNVLILGGWDNMPGAANLSALAALRTGCGKVFICTNNYEKLPNEVIRVAPDLDNIKKVINKINVIIAGPGLGNNASHILKFFWKSNLPLVLDADGLIWLSKSFSKKRKGLLIGTPHHGEAKSLLGKNFKDRFAAVTEIKNKYGGSWVLKGPGTLIYSSRMYVNNFSNSILASGGTGDVLAGIIGSLIAQKYVKPEINGVIIHTKSAKQLLSENKKTLIATDLIEKISSSIIT
tara:strand:- start:797 stop:2128 length:1332 start_codon:yes stop_codon:yes gene_type:complete